MFARRTAAVAIITFCLLLLLPALPVFAIVERYDMNRLAAESVNIVWGQVLNVAPHRTADGAQILSTVTVAVTSYLKGGGATEIRFEIPGGEVDGILQETEDAPHFGVGQETIVFLCDREQPVTGWDQGKFTVVDHRVVEAHWIPVADWVMQLRDVLAKQGYAMPDVAFEEVAEDAVSPMAIPTISSTSPTSASAGTDTHVTITGTNFGAAQGASTVMFWWGKPSTTWTTATTIVSWSNTQIVCHVPSPASSNATQGIKVTTSGGTAYKGFTITFGYRGARWPGSPSEIVYFVVANTADVTNEASAMRSAGWTWNQVDYHHHSIKYFGTGGRDVPLEDGYNEVRWGATGGSIATSTTWSDAGTITETDIEFEDAYDWSTATVCPADHMDIWNIGIHEMGHGMVGLKDLYGTADSEKTMYGYGEEGETKKRTLATQDINAIKWIY